MKTQFQMVSLGQPQFGKKEPSSKGPQKVLSGAKNIAGKTARALNRGAKAYENSSVKDRLKRDIPINAGLLIGGILFNPAAIPIYVAVRGVDTVYPYSKMVRQTSNGIKKGLGFIKDKFKK